MQKVQESVPIGSVAFPAFLWLIESRWGFCVRFYVEWFRKAIESSDRLRLPENAARSFNFPQHIHFRLTRNDKRMVLDLKHNTLCPKSC